MKYVKYEIIYNCGKAQLLFLISAIINIASGRMNESSVNEENIRTEYAAVSAKLNQLPSFRFALIGLYVAGVGLIASSTSPNIWNYFLIIGLTIPLWLIDLRTRWLLINIGNRGIQIEKEWGYEGWISQMSNRKTSESKENDSSSVREPDGVKLFFWKVKLPRIISHSLGFDLLFASVCLYSAVQILILIFY